MSIQEEINEDFLSCDNKHKRNILKFIKSEIQREKNKIVSDDKVIKIIRKNISNEKTLPNSNQFFIEVLQEYLPAVVSDEEIINWIKKNIDFSNYKNKMQAMKDIMSVWSDRIDGNRVKKILNENF